MTLRRTIAALITASSLALLTLPLAGAVEAAPTGAAARVHWYEGKTGTVQWAIGAEFLDQLDAAGATLSFCPAAKIAVDSGSGITIVTMPVHGNSPIQLNGRESGLDATLDCLVTVTGNGASVTMTTLYFTVSSAYASGISATIADEYTSLGNGARKKLPKAATHGRITVVSPVIVVDSAFGDILRAGPVPSMTTDQTNLGIFRLSLKVKPSSAPPTSSGNQEG